MTIRESLADSALAAFALAGGLATYLGNAQAAAMLWRAAAQALGF